MYPFLENVFTTEGEAAVFLQINTPRDKEDLALQFSLIDMGNKAKNLPSEMVESLYDKKSKILNRVYLLDFQSISPGDYQLEIISSDGRIEKIIDIKIIP